MIKITDKRKCSGCTACVSICPVQCISMVEDANGFKYSLANPDKCINCGQCDKVCPFLNPWASNVNRKIAAMASTRDEELKASSSGGVFGGLAHNVLRKGGVVVGAKYDASWESVGHTIIKDTNSLRLLQGSKYIQSDLGHVLAEVKRFLDHNVPVLFSGTPCQIAGLKHYLKKDYQNLLSVEVVCHGVPSPLAWKSYLKSLDIIPSYVNMRHKAVGKGYSILIEGVSSDGKQIQLCEHLSQNIYLRGFLENLYLRPSCFACKAKDLRSHADITLGDFWTISRFSHKWAKTPELVLVNTELGENALDKLIDFKRENISSTSIKKIGNYIQISAPYTSKNQKFFDRIGTEDFHTLVSELLKYTWQDKIIRLLRRGYYIFRSAI